MSLGPFDLTGGPFLPLYGALLVLSIISGLLIPRWLRSDGLVSRHRDADDLAFLAGGAPRLAETVTVLAAEGAMTPGPTAESGDNVMNGNSAASGPSSTRTRSARCSRRWRGRGSPTSRTCSSSAGTGRTGCGCLHSGRRTEGEPRQAACA